VGVLLLLSTWQTHHSSSWIALGDFLPDDHFVCFRFLGRVLGKALFSGNLVKGQMTRTIYKHVLGWPVTFEDLRRDDEDYYTSLKRLTRMDDVSVMRLNFTVTEDFVGQPKSVELIEGGALKKVTNNNLDEYLEAILRYRMLDRTKTQLAELLLGIFDIIPEPALTVFDTSELALLLCGQPTIHIDEEYWQPPAACARRGSRASRLRVPLHVPKYPTNRVSEHIEPIA
jgi:HECT-domain (ubiquitin-transferase)